MKAGYGACAVYALSLLLALTIVFKTVPCQGQLQWSTCVQIEVFEDCSASWFVQRRTSLKTGDDEAMFYQFINATSVDELSNNVRSMVDYAGLVTGRTMRVENFELRANVSRTAFGNEGVLQYQFDWIGFAEKIEDEKIKIGDALSGELDLLPNDVLTIIYPAGYFPSFMYPSPDKAGYSERAVTWLGPRNFGMGEPAVMLEKKGSSWTDVITSNAAIFSVIVAAVFAGFVGYFFGRKRFYEDKGLKPSIGEEQKPLTLLDVEDDEEKVLRLLAAAGGRLLQSTIAKQCGFSKSKTSGLLSAMERKGVVTRKKSGRGKIVTLVKKSQ